METRPVWAEINLNAIEHNLNEVRRLVGQQTKIMAVVKANGYGHGAGEVGSTCLKAGAQRLAVAILNEAIQLREQGFTCPIMVLGWTPTADYGRALANNIILTIYNLKEAEKLAQVAQNLGQEAQVHLKVDTGMTRIGIVANQENVEIARKIIELPHIFVEGIYTHLAKADEVDKTYSYWQLERFSSFVSWVEEKTGRSIPMKHAANSAAIIDLPEAHLDLVRPGIMLYGLKPSPDVNLTRVDLWPALSLKARVSRVEKFPAETKVSYGGIFKAQKETIVASLPLGYADGYTRLLTGKAEVLFENYRFPVIGRICMDQCMVDVTKGPTIEQGEELILIGKGKEDHITVDEIADKLGTINYEVVCMISERVPRKYIK